MSYSSYLGQEDEKSQVSRHSRSTWSRTRRRI